jgi:hypothetical protein
MIGKIRHIVRRTRIGFVTGGICSLMAVFLPLPLCGAGPSDGLRPWPQYRTILWLADSARQGEQALLLQRLGEMGINTAMVYGSQNPAPLGDFPYYVENVVNRGLCLKWNAKASEWLPLIDEWMKGGRPSSAFTREFCLEDPLWLDWARKQAREASALHASHNPLAYDIRDELSVTISANPFDYDFHPLAQAGFRKWLQKQYPDLGALNRQWETQYRSWDEIIPWSTDEIKSRQTSDKPDKNGKPDWQELQRMRFEPAAARKQAWRWNFSPWCDFRSYMDSSLASVLDDLRQTIHRTDPQTPVGIEGTQMPHAFGGYDLWRLSQSLDWVEPYDIGESREIFGDFMRGKPFLCTVGEQDWRKAQRRLWHLLLLGDRGCIVWWSEDCLKTGGDFALTQRALELAPVLKELTSPLGQLWMRAQRETDPVYIHYSQASIQVDWLLESMPDGSTWPRRYSSYESEHNQMAKTRSGWAKALQDIGWSPQFVSSDQIENGFLRGKRGVFIMPTSLAVSDKEADEILSFLASQPERGRLLCDGTPGVFDRHGRIRENPAFAAALGADRGDDMVTLAGVPGTQARSTSKPPSDYLRDRLKPNTSHSLASWIREQIGAVRPAIDLSNAPKVRVHRYTLGRAKLLAFERNIAYAMSEDLKQRGGDEWEQPVEVKISLPEDGFRGCLYDLQKRQYLGDTGKFTFTLDPWHPSLFAILPEKVAPEKVIETLLAQ